MNTIKHVIDNCPIDVDFVSVVDINKDGGIGYRVSPISILRCNQNIGFCLPSKKSYIYAKLSFDAKSVDNLTTVLKMLKKINICKFEWDISESILSVLIDIRKNSEIPSIQRFGMLLYQMIRDFRNPLKVKYINNLCLLKNKRKLDDLQKIFFVLMHSGLTTRISLNSYATMLPYITLEEFNKRKSQNFNFTTDILTNSSFNWNSVHGSPNDTGVRMRFMNNHKFDIVKMYNKLFLKK